MVALTIEQQKLIESELPLVNRIAWKLMRRLNQHRLDIDDLRSVGTVGLISVAKTFEPARNVPFGAFACRRVLGAMLDHVRDTDIMSRSQRRLATAGKVTPHTVTSIDSESIDFLDTLFMDDATPQNIENRMLIETALAVLHGRELFIIQQCFIQGHKLCDIAALLGISDSRVCQLKLSALARMRARLDSTAEPAASPSQPRRARLEKGLSIHSPKPVRCSERQPTLFSYDSWPEEAQL